MLLTLLRYAVFIIFSLACLVAVASWLVRTKQVSPFGPLGRGLRRFSDPVLRRVEMRVAAMGGRPGSAGWWLVIGVAVGGVLVISLAQWLLTAFLTTAGAWQTGPRALVSLLLDAAYALLVLALVVRVVGSWFGAFRYSWWAGPAYRLTDWIVEPLRRVLPPFGPLDWSPLAAWAALWIARALIQRILYF
ncbi:MAG TPA: YggT family protein [Gemmatimonadales bacterium]|nr:YggT family protein [Gemmatimonadales bacterium]